MCGIIGALDLDISKGLQAIAHRGKNAEGKISIGRFNLGHRRLSILDLDERSNQPFIYRNSALVYNGELWNYQDLKLQLQTIGYEFTTTGDVEVVAIALHHWGIEALNKFNGMFSLAWTNGEKLYLARDKFGEVPLYYNVQTIAFASEQKALLALGLRNNELLECGLFIEYDISINLLGRIHQYYVLPEDEIEDTEELVVEKMKALVKNAVEERKIADVPICTLMSGGIDSSLITAILAHSFPDIVAYTAVFNEKSYDLKFARMLSDYLNIKLIEVKIPAPTLEDIQKTIYTIENPLKTQVEIAYPCIKLAEKISQDGFKVTFSGDGSDEMFGSYRFAYYGIRDKGYKYYIRQLYHSLSYRNYIRNNKAFMSNSVEVRLPFASTDLVEFVLNLPEAMNYDPKNEKKLLKLAVEKILPDFVRLRRKVGFQDGLGIKNSFKSVTTISFYKLYYNSIFRC